MNVKILQKAGNDHIITVEYLQENTAELNCLCGLKYSCKITVIEKQHIQNINYD